MKTTAVRLYGKEDLRLETFDLPEITESEILAKITSDSICMSSFKAAEQGAAHKRVPDDVAENPIIIGHEFCGEIVQVGAKWADQFKAGDRFAIQPALNYKGSLAAPGYSYKYVGGSATYCVVPSIVMERGCLIPYEGDNFFGGSLVESLGCVLRGYKGFYHTDYSNYVRTDGAKKGGKLAILGGAGPMGIGAVALAYGYAGVAEVVVTDLSQERLDYAAAKCTVEEAAKHGCKLTYVNTSEIADPVSYLKEISDGGFDDVFVMVPVPALFTMAEEICREDGCVNFFAGPAVHNMQGSINLYRIHYDGIHVVGTAGSIPEDTVDTIHLIEQDKLNVGALVSHILGLRAVPEAILAMEKPNGAKKVCYTGIDIPMIAVDDLEELGKDNALYRELALIVKRNGGLWCTEAEKYLLQNGPKL